MDLITIIIFIIGIVWVISPPFLLKIPKVKKSFQQLNDKKLIEMNVRARTLFKYFIFAFIFIPIAFIATLYFIPDLDLPYFFPNLMFLGIFGMLSGFIIFLEIYMITKSEIEYRKFKKEKGDNNST